MEMADLIFNREYVSVFITFQGLVLCDKQFTLT